MLTLRERFDKYVEPVPECGCHIWIGSCRRADYGQFRIGNKIMTASHVAWELEYGPVPKGLYVLHKCDTSLCVNPHHLFIGTAKDNNQDCMKKGRKPCGENHYKAKLTNENVINIRADNRTHEAIAKDYGISMTRICKIKKRQEWKHI